MELSILQQNKDVLELTVSGADHTFLNLLVKQLQTDKDVTAAAYNIEHPLSGTPKLIVQAKDPKKALDKAVKDLKKQNDEFLAAFSKAA